MKWITQIKDFIIQFFKQTKAFIANLYAIAPRTTPKKLWCFYPEPYRQSIATTAIIFVSVLLLIALVFLGIGLVSLGIYLVAIVIYVGFVALAIWGIIATLEASSNIIAVIIVGAIALVIGKYVFEIADKVWIFGGEFLEKLKFAFVVWQLLSDNLLNIGIFIVFPVVTVFTIAALTIGINYSARYFESFFSWVNGIRYPCPECSQKTEPALYACKNCGNQHTINLLPNEYGIFSHNCEACDSKMPTMMLLKRNKLPHQCQHCSTELSQDALGTDKHIAFVGGTGSGKTCLLMQATQLLIAKNGKIPEEQQKINFESSWHLMTRGETPTKTQVKNIYRAFQVLYKKPIVPWNVHFYDMAGERFEHAQDAADHRFYAVLDAVVFVFDPFSVPDFREQYQKKHPISFQYAVQEPLELVRNLTQVIEKYRLKEGAKKITLNVLMVKTDTGYLPNSNPSGEAIKAFMLNELGQAAFIHHIEHSFPKVNYLHTSALGRTPTANNKDPFTPDNIEQSFEVIYKSVGIKL